MIPVCHLRHRRRHEICDPESGAGTWYHIAAVFDDTNDKYAVYVNGTETSSGTQSFTPQSAAALSFGTRTGSTEYARHAR